MTRKPSEAVTDNMQRVLDFIRTRLEAGQLSPTLTEIADHMEWSSIATVHDVLARLKARKLLRRKKWAREFIIPKAAGVNP